MKSKSRGIQFWTLMFVSVVVSLMMVRQIFLSYAIIHEQKVLVDDHEIADTDDVYQAAWHQLAMSVARASSSDPALSDLLKSEGINVHEGTPPPMTNAVPVPGASSRPAPTPILPPATHSNP